jgi:hypothetical protein
MGSVIGLDGEPHRRAVLFGRKMPSGAGRPGTFNPPRPGMTNNIKIDIAKIHSDM